MSSLASQQKPFLFLHLLIHSPSLRHSVCLPRAQIQQIPGTWGVWSTVLGPGVTEKDPGPQDTDIPAGDYDEVQ